MNFGWIKKGLPCHLSFLIQLQKPIQLNFQNCPLPRILISLRFVMFILVFLTDFLFKKISSKEMEAFAGFSYWCGELMLAACATIGAIFAQLVRLSKYGAKIQTLV